MSDGPGLVVQPVVFLLFLSVQSLNSCSHVPELWRFTSFFCLKVRSEGPRHAAEVRAADEDHPRRNGCLDQTRCRFCARPMANHTLISNVCGFAAFAAMKTSAFCCFHVHQFSNCSLRHGSILMSATSNFGNFQRNFPDIRRSRGANRFRRSRSSSLSTFDSGSRLWVTFLC